MNPPRGAWIFSELLRAKQLGLHGGASLDYTVRVLEKLSDQNFDVDWQAWIEWHLQLPSSHRPASQSGKTTTLPRSSI